MGFISKIKLPTTTPFFKSSVVILSDPNTMIRSVASTSSSSKHHNWTIACIPLTPESNAVASLNIATAVCLTKSNSGLVQSTIMHWAATKTLIIGPNVTVTKLPISGHESSECFSTKAVVICTKKSRVCAIVTACDFNLASLHPPECFWDHVKVSGCTCKGPLGGLDIVPPVSVISHPIFPVNIRKPSNECPSTWVSRHVAINLEESERLWPAYDPTDIWFSTYDGKQKSWKSLKYCFSGNMFDMR